MPSTDSESPDESFFNDLSQQAPDSRHSKHSPSTTENQEAQRDDGANKTKRIACVLCRKRKLRCDGTRPTCGTCKRLAHDCTYDEVRKKSGPKRGYVKLLEARLQQVETLLKSQDPSDQSNTASRQDTASAYVASLQQALPNANEYLPVGDKAPGSFPESISPAPDTNQNGSNNGASAEGEYPWEMIGLGLDEPLPPQDVMNDLYQIYFTKVHPSLPIIHRPRFLAAMNLAPHMRPPVCLRYIMWTLAASVTDKYDGLQEHFYQRARKYAQMDEMKGHGESTITLGHCQSWTLTATYEFKQMYFPRAWLSAGRATRLAQMMQLHRLDGVGLDVKQCLPPPRDWTEREERRRTFWMAFCVDRYASIGTGWPMTIDEKDVLTNLPASEEAFDKSRAMATGSLDQAMTPGGVANLQPFGGIVLTAALFGRNLLHLHRPSPEDRDEDLNGGFWTRHRKIENVLLSTSLGLPDTLRLPAGLPDPNVVFLNMSIHTSAICLHQAAIFKADKHHLPVNVSNESKIRCVTAAAEIASLMRMISHMDLSVMNPFISFCVYVAARVFVQYLKTRPKDQQMNSSLQFLLQAMQALRRKNPLTESFLVQLDLDLESAGVVGIQQKQFIPGQSTAESTTVPVNTDTVRCSPMIEIRETQNPSAPINQFGGVGVTQHSATAYGSSTSGPPFHVANGTLNMENQNTSFITTQTNQQLEIPGRDSSRYTPGGLNLPPSGFAVNESGEMDISPDGPADNPSPATSNSQSRGGSTSHTSYSPGQQQEHLPYRASPKPSSSQTPLPPNANANMFSSSEDMFSPSLFPATGDFMMDHNWEFSTMNNSTGMTPPMSDGGWNQMLESINLGWDSLGPPHSQVQIPPRQ
ncbi:fungal-specific transcription factor domain-containing protein [Massariosphaeria phaeospora]|uniref:Fungal-specific transcription factor domain-containing protein n=1 Tax=Massariosphaeria phaeospora TaxID=100035 RepID=A0A7C8M7V6_9PLEO|nr:fungal-specific transcription factor domain-containing protein [Massariosphaeria phaeospora]